MIVPEWVACLENNDRIRFIFLRHCNQIGQNSENDVLKTGNDVVDMHKKK